MSQGYPEDWNSRRRDVYQRDNYTCQNCGVKGGSRGDTELHAHHIVPKSKGGTHRLENLTTVCKRCHNAIHGRGTARVPIDDGKFPDRVKRAVERYYRTDEYEDGYVRLGKSLDEKGSIQQSVDSGRNTKYDGCPNCGKSALTVSWVGLGPGSKVKVVECESCSAQYDEQVKKMDGQVQRTLKEIDDPSDIDSTGSAVLKELKEQFRLIFNI